MNNKRFINNTSSFISINGKVIEDKEETTYIYNNNGQYINSENELSGNISSGADTDVSRPARVHSMEKKLPCLEAYRENTRRCRQFGMWLGLFTAVEFSFHNLSLGLISISLNTVVKSVNPLLTYVFAVFSGV